MRSETPLPTTRSGTLLPTTRSETAQRTTRSGTLLPTTRSGTLLPTTRSATLALPRRAPAWLLAIAFAVAVGCGGASRTETAHAGHDAIEMGPLDEAALERARREQRPILLTVRAGWCHWCHVMDDTTYRDPAVVALLRERFVVVTEEADARPDLAERYAEQGWPALVLLAPDATEIVALRGYRAPRVFEGILRAIVEDQDAGRALGASLDRGSAARSTAPTDGDLALVRDRLIAQLDAMYDEREEGWGRPQKYPFAAPVMHALYRARVHGEREREARALRTLEQHARLLDPEWGGMFQYSEGGVWDRPHFEKIAAVQAAAIETFAAAYARTRDRRWLDRAREVVRYVRDHLRTPEGAFLASQDADAPDRTGAEFYALSAEERASIAPPRLDPRIYASSNGQLIAALAALSIAAQDDEALALATTAADRVLTTHLGDDHLFTHEPDARSALRHLSDQTEMLRAFIALHQSSAEPRWLAHARSLADATLLALRADSGGLYGHTPDPSMSGTFAERRRPITDNALFASALIVLSRLTDEPRLRDEATAILRAVSAETPLRALGRKVGEYLMALEQLETGHLLIHIVGPEGDPRTESLRRAALAWDDPRRLVEVAAPDHARYPYPGVPSAFLCGETSCSMPVDDPTALAEAADASLDAAR